MEEYGIFASQEIYRQWNKGINPAVYNFIKYYLDRPLPS